MRCNDQLIETYCVGVLVLMKDKVKRWCIYPTSQKLLKNVVGYVM